MMYPRKISHVFVTLCLNERKGKGGKRIVAGRGLEEGGGAG